MHSVNNNSKDIEFPPNILPKRLVLRLDESLVLLFCEIKDI